MLPVIADFNVRLAQESEGFGPGCGPRRGRCCGHAEGPGQRHLLRRRGGGRGGGAVDDHLRVERLAQRQYLVDPERVREAGVPARRGVPRALPPRADAWLRTRKDVCSLRLYVHAENTRARQSYERLGMTRTQYEVFELDVRRDGERL